MRRSAERLQSLACDVLSRTLFDIAVPNGAPAGRRSPSASWSCSSTLRMVGPYEHVRPGPGFDAGASRSRNRRGFVHRALFRGFLAHFGYYLTALEPVSA